MKWRLRVDTENNVVVILAKDPVKGNVEYSSANVEITGLRLADGVLLTYMEYDTHIAYPTIEALQRRGSVGYIQPTQLSFLHEVICTHLCKYCKIAVNRIGCNTNRLKQLYGEVAEGIDTESVLKQLRLA